MKQLVPFFLVIIYCTSLSSQTITWPTPEQTVLLDVVETPDNYYLLLDYGSKEHLFMPCLYGGTHLLSMDKTSFALDTILHFSDDDVYQSIYSMTYLPESNKLLMLGNSKDALLTTPTDLYTILFDLETKITTVDILFDDLLYQIGSINKLTLDNGYTIFNITLWDGNSTPTDGNLMLSFDSDGTLHGQEVLEYEGQSKIDFTSGICRKIGSDSVFYTFGNNSFSYDYNLAFIDSFPRLLTFGLTDKRSAIRVPDGYLVTSNDRGVSFLNSDLEKTSELYADDNTLIGSVGNSLSSSGGGYIYMVDNRSSNANSIAVAKIQPELEEVWRLIIPAPPTYNIIWSHGIFATEDDHAIVFGSVGTWLDEDLDAFIYIIDSDGGLVSTAEPLTQAELHISPNPAAGYVDIEVSDLATGSRCRVTDLSGRLFLEQKLSSISTRLDVDDIPAGMYILQLIESGRVLASEKLVKQ